MSDSASTVAVEHDGDGRFTSVVDGTTAHLDYQREGGLMTITHTIVPPAIGGRGIAARLVETALEFARAQGLKVVPRCSYAAGFIARHPDYADLMA